MDSIKTFYIIPEALFGNCLRNIASCYIIANYFHYDKIFINFGHSYVRPKEEILLKTLFPDWCVNRSSTEYYTVRFRDIGDISTYFFSGTNVHLITEGQISLDPKNKKLNNIGLSAMIYSVIPKGMSINEYICQKLLFYKNVVKFPSEIQSQSDNFRIKHNIKDYIAFHIRYTDNLTDLPKFNTKLEHFIEKIKTFHNENILICSDNRNVILQFKKMSFNNNQLFFADECNYPDDKNKQYFQPLYELMLLSDSKLIIGSCCSTFSYESAFFKGTDIELFEPVKYNNLDYKTFVWNKYHLSQYKDKIA